MSSGGWVIVFVRWIIVLLDLWRDYGIFECLITSQGGLLCATMLGEIRTNLRG